MSKIPEIIHTSWHEYLQPLFEDAKMNMIKEKIRESTFYPSADLVFRVFKMPIDKIRVVILGQDPYIKPNQAIGLAFAVPEETGMPPTLNIIKNEVYKDATTVEEMTKHTNWRTLQHWVNQGVFLLNSALTVEAGKSGSHAMYWQWFTRQVVDIISKHHASVWMLWGAKAQSFESYIHNRVIGMNILVGGENIKVIDAVSKIANAVLKAPHPAAETYDSNTLYKFTGCNHFNLCNEIFRLKGEAEINW